MCPQWMEHSLRNLYMRAFGIFLYSEGCSLSISYIEGVCVCVCSELQSQSQTWESAQLTSIRIVVSSEMKNNTIQNEIVYKLVEFS